MKKYLTNTNFALIFLGITSLITQVILIRELITAFYGNELFLGLTLAFWLLSTGLGSILFSKLFKKNIDKVLFWLYLSFPIVLVGAYLLTRAARAILTEPGVIPNLITASLWSFIVIAPSGFILGMLFVLLVRKIKNDRAKAVTKGYIIESLGFLLGALIFSFLLVTLPTLTTIGVLLVVCLLIALLFSFKTYLRGAYFVSALIILIAISLGWAMDWDQTLLKWYYPDENIITSINSKYSSIHVSEINQQINFYLNGHGVDNSENTYHNELISHYPLILQENPQTVLLIGNGFTGILNEINKYPISRINYLELDKDYYESASKLLNFKLPDNSTVIHEDTRSFLKNSRARYDAVIINYSNPSTLAENRYFTQEFFRLVKSRLNQTGIISLFINTTPNYTVGSQNKLLTSLYRTLSSEFKYVKVFPDNEVIFLASPSEIKHDMNIIEGRYEQLGINNHYAHPGYLYWRIKNDRTKKLANNLEKSSAPLNSDLKPTLYYYQLQTFLEKMNVNIKLISSVVLFFISFLFLLIFIYKKLQITNYKLLISSMLPEFSLIAFEVLLILLFQTYHGILYTQLSFIIALVLLGIALGSYIFNKLLNNANINKLTKLSFLLITLTFLVFLIIAWQLSFLFNFQLTFYILSLFAGFAIGTKFPVINKLYLQKNTNLGAVYGADLIGGAVGALLASTLFLPFLGVIYSLSLFVFLCLISLIILLFFSRVS